MKSLVIFLMSLISCLLVVSKLNAQQPKIQYWRPYSQEGINVFETSKEDTVDFEGLRVRIGGNFTQQFQNLDHSNDPEQVTEETMLIDIGSGFNLATANLNLDVQLADGIRLNLVTYLSSRHHPEAWVKGGYLQVDKLEFLNSAFLNELMNYLTIRAGHMEINYGDAHFRRTDNGNALYNPFVGNLIMDAFNTEIGGEVYFQSQGFLAMVALTGGEINGSVLRPEERAPSFYAKLGYDQQMNDALRFRLTGSLYTTSSSLNNSLYSGDRGGSRYYLVMENTSASVSSNFTSGRFNPGFRDEVTAFVVNPFVKFDGLELFGNIERAQGRAADETEDRAWNQFAVDVLYRFFADESLYIGARYNTINGELQGSGQEASINRVQLGAGWFVTKNILLKAEYVNQNYNDFPQGDIRHEGKFDGLMIEGVIGF